MNTGGDGPDRRAFLARALKGAVFAPPVIETLAAPAFVQNQLSPKQKGMMGKTSGPLLMGTDPGKGIPPPWLQAPTPPPPSLLRSSNPGDE